MADNEAPTVTIGLDLESEKLLRELKALQDQVGKQTKETGKAVGENITGGFSKSVNNLMGKLVALGSVALSAFAFNKIIEAAKQSEDALNRFNTALALSGEYSQQTSDKFQKLAAELQNKSIFDDEAILNSAAKIQTLGNLSAPALERATKASVELASALRIDLEQASQLVAKASQGNTDSLGRYGIKIDATKDKVKDFEQVLSLIEKRFSGSAQAQTMTYSGAITQLGNNFENLLETLGSAITQSPKLIAVFKFISDSIVEINDYLSKDLTKVNFVDSLVASLISFAQATNSFVLKPLEIVWNFTNLMFTEIATGINFLISGFAKVASWGAKLAEFFGVGGPTTQAIIQFSTVANQAVVAGMADADAQIKTLLNTDMSNSISTGLANLKSKVDSAKPFEGLKNTLKSTVVDMTSEMKTLIANTDKMLAQGLVNLISSAMVNIGTQLGGGTFAFSDFAATILNILGDLMIQVGGVWLSIGLGIEALKTGFFTISGAAPIAAGLAMILSGGILKGLAGGMKSAASAQKSTMANTAINTAPSQPENIQQPEMKKEEEPKTQIIVNGSYFDTDEAGSRMVNLINGANSRTGSRIRREAIA